MEPGGCPWVCTDAQASSTQRRLLCVRSGTIHSCGASESKNCAELGLSPPPFVLCSPYFILITRSLPFSL